MTIIQGNISKAAETRMVTTKDGTKTMVTDFNVAENIGYGENQKTKFWKVTIWRDRGANLAPHLTVGRPVYIVGEAGAEAYINNEGKAVAQLTLTRPTEVKLIGKKPVAEDAFDGNEVEE